MMMSHFRTLLGKSCQMFLVQIGNLLHVTGACLPCKSAPEKHNQEKQQRCYAPREFLEKCVILALVILTTELTNPLHILAA